MKFNGPEYQWNLGCSEVLKIPFDLVCMAMGGIIGWGFGPHMREITHGIVPSVDGNDGMIFAAIVALNIAVLVTGLSGRKPQAKE